MRIIETTVATLALLVTIPVSAGLITNGDFENGDLTGWDVLAGSSSAVTEASTPLPGVVVPALAGTFSGQVLSGPSNADAADLDAFFGLPTGSIGAAPLSDPGTENAGAGIRQTVEVAAGDTLTFLWNVLGLEFSDPFNDAAFFATTDGGGTIVELLDGVTASADGTFRTTFSESYAFQTSGLHTIGFGIINGGDSCCSFESVLVDNVSLSSSNAPNPVPVPATLCLIGLGLIGFRFRRGR